MISGVITSRLSHSGCRYSLHPGLTWAANSSAHLKSDLLKIIIFSSLASGMFSGSGALNFLGDKVTQSQSPVSGLEAEVSICVRRPAAFKAVVIGTRLYIDGSPPVTT